MAVEKHRFRKQFAQGIGQRLYLAADRLAGALQAAEQYHKLIAAQARHGVLHAHAGFQAGGDDFQHGVANGVAEGVVDVLEVVQVQKQQGAAQVVALEQGDLLAQAVHQQCAVRQVGQRVVIGQVTDLRLGVLQ